MDIIKLSFSGFFLVILAVSVYGFANSVTVTGVNPKTTLHITELTDPSATKIKRVETNPNNNAAVDVDIRYQQNESGDFTVQFLDIDGNVLGEGSTTISNSRNFNVVLSNQLTFAERKQVVEVIVDLQ